MRETKPSFWSSFFGRKKEKIPFENSKQYWETRYRKNKNSGAGSYGRLADFKAAFLNDFVDKEDIELVVEYGCGDGNQLSLAHYPEYIGLDVSPTAVELCQEKFKEDPTKEFYTVSEFQSKDLQADLVLSLDVIYHLVEDKVFESYMTDLFATSTKYVIIYSSNYNDHSDLHVRSRKFTDWIDQHRSEQWTLKTHIKNKYPFNKKDKKNTSWADFYVYEKRG